MNVVQEDIIFDEDNYIEDPLVGDISDFIRPNAVKIENPPARGVKLEQRNQLLQT